MKMKTLLVIDPGKDKEQHEGVFNILVAETGEHLASHYCSNWTFAWGDLYADRPERIAEWTERFGEFEVKFLTDTEITRDELIRRNKEWYKSVSPTSVSLESEKK
jgi:hypothetical protein